MKRVAAGKRESVVRECVSNARPVDLLIYVSMQMKYCEKQIIIIRLVCQLLANLLSESMVVFPM